MLIKVNAYLTEMIEVIAVTCLSTFMNSDIKLTLMYLN